MKIHLNSRPGMYTVTSYDSTYIWVVTKRLPEFTVPCSDFKSFAGGNNNDDMTGPESDRFLSVVNPSMFQHQQKMTESIMEAVKALAMQPMQHANNNQPDNNHEVNQELKRVEKELIALKHKALEDAREVYRYTIPHNEFRLIRPIKFIIQENVLDGTLRFKYDPYGFVDNFHSALSHLFKEADWSTINGGWIQCVHGKIILFGKSGDYGVYDDTVASELASKLFTEKIVFSHAGAEMLDISHLYDDMPF